MLWLCIRLPKLVREALAGSQPSGSSGPQPSGRPSSEKELQIQNAALERLAAWAYQWSSLVSYTPDEPLLWLELGASSALFEGHAALLAKIQVGLAQLGYSHICALAPSATGAALLTRVQGERQVFTRAQLRERLDGQPLSLLDLPAETLAALHTSGLRCIGQLLAMPAAAIARRFGPEMQLYLQQLCGEADDPRPAWRLPERYRARFEFDVEIRTSTALLFPLQRLLLEFQGYLRARDCAVLRFTLEFEHYRHPTSRVTIGLSAAGRNAAQFLTLVRERLHALLLPAPVSALRLEALEFAAPSIAQTDLFGSDVQPLQQLQRLLDRLRARLGENSVQSLQLQADYRPERGWRAVAPESVMTNPTADAATTGPVPSRPGWLLHEPIRIAAPGELLRGPERIESGWWEQADISRDYYLARTDEGSRIWVFQDRRGGEWYLQGLWA